MSAGAVLIDKALSALFPNVPMKKFGEEWFGRVDGYRVQVSRKRALQDEVDCYTEWAVNVSRSSDRATIVYASCPMKDNHQMLMVFYSMSGPFHLRVDSYLRDQRWVTRLEEVVKDLVHEDTGMPVYRHWSSQEENARG